jgi:hypothetical protein
MSWLITPSLIGGFEYYLEDSEYRTNAQKREDFLRMLSRERSDADSYAAKMGRDFEANVMAYCDVGGYENAPANIREIGDLCMGGYRQVSMQRQMGEFLFYGKADIILRDAVKDIKWTRHYDIGKFLDSAQHLVYLFCQAANDVPIKHFQYLINEEKYGKSLVFIEDYYATPDLEHRLMGKTRELMAWFENDTEAGDLFRRKWKALS